MVLAPSLSRYQPFLRRLRSFCRQSLWAKSSLGMPFSTIAIQESRQSIGDSFVNNFLPFLRSIAIPLSPTDAFVARCLTSTPRRN